jgi:AAA15 family ATPase/GTPase
MLLRFTVENALCFGPEATLSLIATNDDRHPTHVTAGKGKRPDALRVAALYGANGHGKTNIVRAIAALKTLVGDQKWSLPRFKLDPASKHNPTRMVIEFRHGKFDYEYGVVMNGRIVEEEWLFQTNARGKEEMLFERISSKLGEIFETKLLTGKILKNENSPVENIKMDKYLEILAAGLKENRPFLSECEERDIPIVQPAFEWLTEILTPITVTANYVPLFERVGDDTKFRVFLQDFLKKCDVGIEELSAKTVKIDSSLSAKLPEYVKEQMETLEEGKCIRVDTNDGVSMVIDRDEDGQLIMRDIGAVRLDSDGTRVDFSFEEESSGTRRLLDLAPMLSDPSDNSVYVVDELDRKLHPMLSYRFVRDFLSKKSGQLILTTHNTHLMDLDLLRRDEIWFVQKRLNGSSDLYSLAEMKIRPDLNVRKGYMSGRFGAIPYLGNAASLVDD